MNPRELRYLNWVEFQGHPFKVNNVHGASGLIHVLPLRGVDSPGTRGISDYSPIRLTKENRDSWLEKLGWYKYEENHWSKSFDQGIGVIKIDDSELDAQVLFIVAREKYKPIKFVHQLQNFWAAWTDQYE